jgi:ABC-type branched-subunit amino acid transport system permease subunit
VIFLKTQNSKLVQLFGHTLSGVPGLHMVLLSLALLLVIIFFRRGLLGRREFSGEGLGRWWCRIVTALAYQTK